MLNNITQLFLINTIGFIRVQVMVKLIILIFSHSLQKNFIVLLIYFC